MAQTTTCPGCLSVPISAAYLGYTFASSTGSPGQALAVPPSNASLRTIPGCSRNRSHGVRHVRGYREGLSPQFRGDVVRCYDRFLRSNTCFLLPFLQWLAPRETIPFISLPLSLNHLPRGCPAPIMSFVLRLAPGIQRTKAKRLKLKTLWLLPKLPRAHSAELDTASIDNQFCLFLHSCRDADTRIQVHLGDLIGLVMSRPTHLLSLVT
ncbi:uncharacterized protein BCR38DRAFT_123098 [Pseudomassariella vexata]|uniref:Uncharacterized protein n=1 Tax=Pseudomassariella vexata TaxID=1141098 RepID=A0A1Y2D8R0_9PEZI|nr:uncharacterized protein BCR38DRAFT_123098 [Pseudomassariella vexata]ORY55653.1 hypothetical protein BCR38DRAFT_123098 [Pseudomassariella vexata]